MWSTRPRAEAAVAVAPAAVGGTTLAQPSAATLQAFIAALRDWEPGLVAIIAHDEGRTWSRHLADAQTAFESNFRGRAVTAEAVLFKTIPEHNGGLLAVLERQQQKHATH